MNKSVVQKLVGKHVYAVHKTSGNISGKLVKVSGQKLYIQPVAKDGKKVRTSAVIPLVLFDLLAIGTAPYAYGGFGYGYPGGYYGGFGGYPGYFW